MNGLRWTGTRFADGLRIFGYCPSLRLVRFADGNLRGSGGERGTADRELSMQLASAALFAGLMRECADRDTRASEHPGHGCTFGHRQRGWFDNDRDASADAANQRRFDSAAGSGERSCRLHPVVQPAFQLAMHLHVLLKHGRVGSGRSNRAGAAFGFKEIIQ